MQDGNLAIAYTPQADPSRYSTIGVKYDPEVAKKALQLIRGRTPLLTPESAAAIVEGLENGKTLRTIAGELGVNPSTISQWQAGSPDLSEAVAQARQAWTHAVVEKGIDGVENADENSMISVRKAESYGKLALDIAGRLNPDYSPKSQQKNLNVNVTIDEPVSLDMFRK